MILGFEKSFLPLGTAAKLEAIESLLQACETSTTAEPVWFVDGKTRLDLAKLLRSIGRNEDADREFRLATKLLQQAPVTAMLNHLDIDVQFAQLESTADPDLLVTLNQWVSFTDNIKVQQDPHMLSSALHRAAEAASEIVGKEPTEENRMTFWHWQSKAMSMFEQLGDIYYYHLHCVTTGQAVSLRSNDHGKVLQWLEDFQVKYPNFSLFQSLMMGLRNKLMIYSALKDQTNMFKTVNEIQDLTHHCSAFWQGIEGYDNETPSAKELKPQIDQQDKCETFRANNLEGQWFSDWAHEADLQISGFSDASIRLGTNVVGKAHARLETLLRWLQDALVNDELSDADLENLLEIKKQNDSDARIVLRQLDVNSLSLKLFGADSTPKSSARWQETFLILSDWLVEKAHYDELKRHMLLAYVQMQMVTMMVNASYMEDSAIEAQRLLGLTYSLGSAAQEILKTNRPPWRNIICGAKKTMYVRQDLQSMLNEENAQFLEIVSLYKISLDEFRNLGHIYGQAMTSLFLAQQYFWPALNGRPAAFGAFFEHLDNADTMFRRIREGWKVLSGWDKVQKLLQAAEETFRLQVTPLAVQVLVELPDTQQEERDKVIWSMTQEAKCSGLGWLMQTNNAERSSIETLELPQGHKELSQISLEDLKLIADDAGGDVVFVDWYNGSLALREMSHPLIVVVAPYAPPRVSRIMMTWTEIEEIVGKLISLDEEDLMSVDTNQLLYKLNPLVKSLAAASKPGQTLVFALTDNLHRIPFHALQVDGKILIRRNPIVYSSSMTVLDLAFKARRKAEEARLLANVAFKPSLFCDPPSQLGIKAYKSLAAKLSVTPHTSDAFTSSNLVNALKDPDLSLLHYHSHATFNEIDPLNQGLELDDRHFNMREVFDLAPVPASYHATLLGCGSGMTKTTASNDVVGLVSAFLYSGASSTLSTLWSFDDKDAAMYTRHFYKEIVELVEAGVGGTVDLAKANQRVVLAIMEKRPGMYHWAPFIFNGYWMLRIPGKRTAC